MSSVGDTIFKQLDSDTAALSIDALLSELQIAVERISFSHLAQATQKLTRSDVDLLFEDELSPNMMQFIYWLTDQHYLPVLAGETGRLFFNHCSKRYRQSQQITFQTAIALTEVDKQAIAHKLRPLYPLGARLIFEIEPNIVAGFRITDKSRTVDKSMREAMNRLTSRRVQETFNG